jgi:hypothetical protein
MRSEEHQAAPKLGRLLYVAYNFTRGKTQQDSPSNSYLAVSTLRLRASRL